MVNASPPTGYVEYQNANLQLESDRLVTKSGYIYSETDFIQLDSKQAIRLGGEYDTTNLQFFGVNDFSNDSQDVEVYVRGVVVGQRQQGEYEIYSKSNKLYAGHSAEINAPSVKIQSTNRYDICDAEYRIDTNNLDINATKGHICWIASDNSATTENSVTTIKSNQLNLDGQEVTIRAGSVIPASIYSHAANSHPGGFKVHGETMLDWVNCKNLCIPGYDNNVFAGFNKLYYNYNLNRIELCLSSGQVVATPTMTLVSNTQLVEQSEGETLMALAAEGLLSNEAQIPSESGLVVRLETARPTAPGTLQMVVDDLNRADPDALMT